AAGRPAFPGATSAVISAAILHETPPAPHAVRPQVPDRLEQMILKAIEKDRALRDQHASEIRADLQRLKRDSTSKQSAVAAGTVAASHRRRMPIAAVIAATAAAIAAAAAVYFYTRRAPVLTDKDTIVVGEFKNTTGDDVFDET